MDLKLIATTFVAVFLAELGDKTQLATLSFAIESKSRWSVFIGSAGALVVASAVAVVVGDVIARHVSAVALRRAAGALFLVIGAWTLWATRA